MVATKNDPAGESDREIVLTRVFDAPRELVWKVWTKPDHLANWWGPRGFTTTTHRMEVKQGGVWQYVMHGPDGRDYDNIITYLEVVEPERLTYKHGGAKDTEPVNFQATVTFDPQGPNGEKTKVTMRSLFPSQAARDFVVREVNAIEGGKQTLQRLAEHLDEMQRPSDAGAGSTGRPFAITHVLHADRERLWQVWTEREALLRWFGPKGITIPRGTLDLRPGGVFHYCMRTPDGHEMWGKWIFREIHKPDRLVFVVSFSDENGSVTRAPFDGNWPLETLSTVSFAEHAGIGRGTVVTVEWSALNATAAEQKAFDAGHESMRQGWTGTFEQLAEYLASG
jgi:uncharacterized protein YndB with AHSA1/START domain